MRKHLVALLVFLCLALVGLGQSLFPLVVVGDGAGGGVDAPGTPWLEVGVIMLLVAVFLVPALFLPRIAEWALNIPHKDHWLNPKRRERSLDYVRSWTLWFGSLSLLLVILVFHAVRGEEATGERDPSAVLFLVVAYGVVSLVFLVHLLLRFGRVENGGIPDDGDDPR